MGTYLKIAGILLAVLATAGCAKYWTRDQAALADFASDHRDCLATTGVPVVSDPSRVVPNEQEYRRCLIARGWTRRNASWVAVPSGYYRGYEEREEFKPVKVDELPEQPTPAGSSREIRLSYPKSSDRRRCVGDSAEECARQLESQGWVRAK
jgi:hypothetical protein